MEPVCGYASVLVEKVVMKKLSLIAGAIALLGVGGCVAPVPYGGVYGGVYTSYPATYYGSYYVTPVYHYDHYHPYYSGHHWDGGHYAYKRSYYGHSHDEHHH
jgi:hypothetical protein